MNQRSFEQTSILGEHHLPGFEVEVGKLIVPFAWRRRELVAEPEIQRQPLCDAVVVLDEVELHILPLVHHGVAGQRQL